MSSVAGLIPKIEGFQPIPNAVMIPFMETQSAALAFGFGLNYEYGKRTIRSMSNETFNSLTSEQIAEMSANHSTILLNRFIQAVPQVMPAQTEIFKQYVEIEKAKVLQNVALAKWIATNAPSIITRGTTADTNIRTTPETNNPPAQTSSNVTSISQDAQGKITTTTKSKLTISQQSKLIAHYNNNIKILSLKITQQNVVVKSFVSTRWKGGRQTAYIGSPTGHSNAIKQLNKMQVELKQQQLFLSRVKKGEQPY